MLYSLKNAGTEYQFVIAYFRRINRVALRGSAGCVKTPPVKSYAVHQKPGRISERFQNY